MQKIFRSVNLSFRSVRLNSSKTKLRSSLSKRFFSALPGVRKFSLPKWIRNVGKIVLGSYFLLAFIPHGMTSLSIYHWLTNSPDRSRGWAFFAITGYACLPYSFIALLGTPYVYFFDWEERSLYTWVFNSWAQMTCRLFFVPEISGHSLPLLNGSRMGAQNKRVTYLHVTTNPGLIFIPCVG